jgi:hypothetical protein
MCAYALPVYTVYHVLTIGQLTQINTDIALLRAISSVMEVGAGAMKARVTSGAAPVSLEMATNKENVAGMSFVNGVKTYADFVIPSMPSDWNAGTVTVNFIWMANDATNNTVGWFVAGRCFGDGDALDQALGTEQTIVDANASTAYQIRISAATPALTLNGTVAQGNMAYFSVYRKDTGDTLAVAAILLGVIVNYTRT